MSNPFRHFDGMCWPAPSEALNDCAHTMTWHNCQVPPWLASQMLVAAAAINAYNELVRLPAKKRDAVIRELRKGPTSA